jgi:hypothetical protein
MRSKWYREWHLLPRPHIEWAMRSWKSLRFNLKNSSRKVISNQTNHHMGHPSFLFTRMMGHWECVLIIKHSTRQRWRTGILCLESMIYLIVFREPKYLVRLTYVRNINKFGLRKGTKKRPLVAQGMVHTNSWWCLLGSPMHPPHFALSWMTFSRNGSMILWSST